MFSQYYLIFSLCILGSCPLFQHRKLLIHLLKLCESLISNFELQTSFSLACIHERLAWLLTDRTHCSSYLCSYYRLSSWSASTWLHAWPPCKCLIYYLIICSCLTTTCHKAWDLLLRRVVIESGCAELLSLRLLGTREKLGGWGVWDQMQMIRVRWGHALKVKVRLYVDFI